MKIKNLLALAILSAIAFTSCKKNSDRCYECDITNTGVYLDYGCMSQDQWDNTIITDPLGGQLDKNQVCRYKR